MSKSHRSLVRAFALLALPVMFSIGPVEASNSDAGVPSVTVRYHDLNLDSSTDVASLYARIHVAAAVVCTLSEDDRASKLALRTERDKCINHAVARAVLTVRNGNLSAYHWQQIRGWNHRSGEIRLADRAHQ
ncbi:MAG: UrcA family protein [Gammaproteobacteria bacterium]